MFPLGLFMYALHKYIFTLTKPSCSVHGVRQCFLIVEPLHSAAVNIQIHNRSAAVAHTAMAYGCGLNFWVAIVHEYFDFVHQDTQNCIPLAKHSYTKL